MQKIFPVITFLGSRGEKITATTNTIFMMNGESQFT